MLRRRVCTAAAFLASLALALPAAAQDISPGVHEHDGFYLRMGLGAGYSVGTAKPDRVPDADIGGMAVATELSFGGTISPGLVVGGGAFSLIVPSPKYSFGGQEADAGTHHVGGVGPFADYYFDPGEGLHVQAALLLAYMVIDKSDTSEGSSGGGFGTMLGVGYEVWIGEQWSLGPLFRVTYHRAKTKQENSDIEATVGLFTPTLLVGLTYH